MTIRASRRLVIVHRVIAASFAVIAAIAMWSTSHAVAQDSPAAAEDLLEQAIRLREQRRDRDALPLFRRAYEMWPSPRTEAQLGLAHQAVGDWAAAYQHLAAALASPRDAWIASRRRPLEEALRVVRAEVGLVSLRGGPPGGQVFVAGRIVATLPASMPIAVAPGRTAMELRAPGRVARVVTVEAVRGQQLEESAELAVDPSSSTPSTGMPDVVDGGDGARDDESRGETRSRRGRGSGGRGAVWAWVFAGSSVALAGAAGIAWWRAGEAYAELEDGCGRTRACTDAQIAASGAPGLVTLTNVLIVSSAVVAAGAVVLFVLEPSSGDDDDTRERSRGRSSAARIGIGPGSVVFSGRF